MEDGFKRPLIVKSLASRSTYGSTLRPMAPQAATNTPQHPLRRPTLLLLTSTAGVRLGGHHVHHNVQQIFELLPSYGVHGPAHALPEPLEVPLEWAVSPGAGILHHRGVCAEFCDRRTSE